MAAASLAAAPSPDERLGVDAGRLLEGLTSEQARAVTHDGPPLIVLAGPGSGKTRTLTHRIAWLIATGRATADQILALTFTVRAADEMRVRLGSLLGEEGSRGLTAGTFHSISARMLRANAQSFGRTERYTIYDEVDAKKLLTAVIADRRRGIAEAAAECGMAPVDEVYDQMSLAKGELLSPREFKDSSRHPTAPMIAAAWAAFDEEMIYCDAFTFDDLIQCVAWLLANHPPLRNYYRRKWPAILVDEFQDTNLAQLTLVRLLADRCLTVVGDDDQALYSFQGARVDNILRFGENFADHQRLVLGRNFRCRAEILQSADALIRHNVEREPKRLLAERGAGGYIKSFRFAGDEDEAAWIARKVGDALARGISPDEIQVLHPAKWVSQPLQRALARARIPYRVLGSLGLFERAAVKTALAYVRLLVNPNDQLAFERAVNQPARGVGEKTRHRVARHARAEQIDLIAACRDASSIPGLKARPREALVQFGIAIDGAAQALRDNRSLTHAVISVLLMDGGLVEFYKSRLKGAAGSSRERDVQRTLDDLRSVVGAVSAYEKQESDATLAGFLEQTATLNAAEPDGTDRRVTLSSVHRSKGTEAAVVFVQGLEEGVLPGWRAIRSATRADLEEQRRAVYVAITRGRNVVLLCNSVRRTYRSRELEPSRFLGEAGFGPAPGTA